MVRLGQVIANLFKRRSKRLIQKGDRIRILSWPRRYDGADAYAGVEGVVTEVNLTERNNLGRGHIELWCGTSWFVGSGLQSMRFEFLD
jgi:hypothetical protein